MGFAIDYSKISLDSFLDKLKTKHLVPSRRLLRDNIDEKFDILRNKGISNVEELFKILKKKSSFNNLLTLEVFSEEYLTILLREVKSIQTKPTKLADFYNLPKALISKMEMVGLKNTKQFYPKMLTKKLRSELAVEADCEVSEIEILARLSDLTRVQWVNHTFAIMLYQLGYDTLKKLQCANPDMLHKEVNELNKKENIYRGSIGLNDINICIEASKDVSIETDFK